MVISESHKDRWCHLYVVTVVPFQGWEGPMPIRKMIPNWGAEILGSESRSYKTGYVSWHPSFCPLSWTTVLYSPKSRKWTYLRWALYSFPILHFCGFIRLRSIHALNGKRNKNRSSQSWGIIYTILLLIVMFAVSFW